MKLWRKLAMKEGRQDGRRPGRQIKQMYAMQEYIFSREPKLTRTLEILFKNIGLPTPQRIKLSDDVVEGATNEVK